MGRNYWNVLWNINVVALATFCVLMQLFVKVAVDSLHHRQLLLECIMEYKCCRFFSIYEYLFNLHHLPYFMDEIITDDGSLTYRSEILDEPYHTKAGAIVEALEKHARALKVWEKDCPVIFDVCSGLSYSAACALEEIRSNGNNSLVTIYLFENDRTILEKNLNLPDSIKYTQDGALKKITCYHHFKAAIRKYLHHNINVYKSENLRITLMFGDFYLTINSVEESADFVFYAPFSPMFTPQMWSYKMFRILFMHMSPHGQLTTYSYAKKVRDALTEAGFKVRDGPILGRRSPSLIAAKD